MGKQVKSLVLANPSANVSRTAYTVPSGKYAVAKSVTISNSSTTDLKFRLIIGGAYVAYDYTLKGKDTLAINDLDIPLLPGETIIIMASSSSCFFKVSGFEDDYIQSEYPYLKLNVMPVNTAASITKDSDMIIRSIIICNSSGTTTTSIFLDAPSTLVNKDIKPNDSLLLLNFQYFISKNENIVHRQTSTGGLITFVMEKVGG